MQHRTATLVSELDMAKNHIPHDRGRRPGTLRILVFGTLPHDFTGAFEACERLAELRPDIDDPHHGRDQESQERYERHVSAWGKTTGEDLAGPDVHHECAHNAHQNGGR